MLDQGELIRLEKECVEKKTAVHDPDDILLYNCVLFVLPSLISVATWFAVVTMTIVKFLVN